MFKQFLFVLLLTSCHAFAAELPDKLFGIRLGDPLSAIEGEVNRGKGVVRIKGVAYRYYTVLDDRYTRHSNLEQVLVQVKENDGTIVGVIGQTSIDSSGCLTMADNFRHDIENQMSIRFQDRHDSDYYVMSDDGRSLILGCEIKKESLLKLILTNLQ